MTHIETMDPSSSTRAVAITVLSVAIVAGLAGCSTPPAPPNLTVEEAGFLAKGELFRIYGEAADPVAVSIGGEPRNLDGRPVWALHLTVQVTENGERRTVEWDVAVGVGPEGPTVVRAEQRR